MHSISKPLINVLLPLLAAVAAYLFGTSRAWAEPVRRGGQWEILAGGTACVDGHVECDRSNDAVSGRTLPSFGGGLALGWRAARWLQLGGAYRFGMFNPDYEFVDESAYDFAYQHSVYIFARPIIPIWRIDLGVDLGPGYSRQVFRRSWQDYDAAHGFSFLVGPVINVYLTDSFFLGAKVDLLFNAYDEVCVRRDGSRACAPADRNGLGPTHQLIYGVHLGGNLGF